MRGSRDVTELLRAAGEAFWTLTAQLMDQLRSLGSLGAGLSTLILLSILMGAAWLMQRRLIRRLRQDPAGRVGYWGQEVWFFLPVWLILPFLWIGRGLGWLGRRLVDLLARRPGEGREGGGGEDGEGEVEGSEEISHLAATLGPSFLLAALITAALYLVCRLVEPLLAARYGLTPGVSAWQYLLLGHRPELAPFLPLDRSPYLAALLAVLLWLTLWWWAGRAVRLALWGCLRRNLIREVENPTVLPVWRRWFGVRRLWRPAGAYRTWAVPLVGVAALLGAWAWASLGDPEQPVRPSEMAVVVVLFTGWSLHLWLEGERRGAEPQEREPESPAVDPVPGWPEVVEDLRCRLQVIVPEPFRPPRRLGRPARDLPLAEDPLLSPLLCEALPAGASGLSAMQLEELRRLSRLGHVHLQPPRPPGELGLDSSLPGDLMAGPDEPEERNRIVLAPEGWGKTQLALLAAVNHALVHTRCALLVARDEEGAEELHQALLRRLRGSGLRWNVRLRRVGSDLVQDLSEGIVPDILVTSLHRLVVGVLDELDLHAPFFRNLGLIVVDDVESFSGPVEVHAQLAFRRLTLAARREAGVRELGERNAPLVLALGSESMHRMSSWVSTLLGVDASTARHVGAGETESGAGGDGQLFYRLRDFRTAAGERLDLFSVVESCERTGVAWHYRLCRDGLRHRGRKALPLSREPRSFTSEPGRAGVVLLDGSFSEVHRELQRLALAGAEHGGGPCALLTLGDPDEDMALAQRDDSSSLAELLGPLPRPILRATTGQAISAHLSSDLVRTWTEVADILHTFGHGSAHKLRQLAREGLLLTEERTDLPPEAHEYETVVFVRSLAAAVEEARAGEEGSSALGARRPLPRKVSQVELASERWLAVRDRTDLAEMFRVEAESADFLYYPGRLFADTQGRYLVVHRAAREGAEGSAGAAAKGDVLVEPTLSDDVSSPRYQDRVRVVDLGEGTGRGAPGPRQDGSGGAPEEAPSGDAYVGHAFSGPDPVLLGDRPFQVALARIQVERRYLASLRLGPVFGEVRQRRIFDAASRQRFGRARLDTVALALFPNPELPEEPGEGEPVPLLQLEPARLLVAALRLVLPSLLRGAGESLGVTLRLRGEAEDCAGLPEGGVAVPEGPTTAGEALHEPGTEGFVPEHGPVLQPAGGLFFFDLAARGNGAARALHRDGLEPLLRMARLVIERVLYHDRLRAFHDHWATLEDPAGHHVPPGLSAGIGDAEERLRAVRRWDQGVREAALTWLDSRLRPEGTPAVAADSLGRYGSGDEDGEGDLIDIGRCWYTADSLVTDLLWAKHRWRRNPSQEVMLDLAFDRTTAEKARFLTPDSLLLERGRRLHRRMQEKERKLPDGTVWGRPRGVWFVTEDPEDPPRVSQGSEADEATEVQRQAFARAAHGWPVLAPLVDRVRGELFPRAEVGDPRDRFEMARDLARFVQGVATLAPGALPGPEGTVWTTVDTLLGRRGDLTAKSLLLALLLRRCGIESGLFVSFAEGRTLSAAALPGRASLASWSFRVRRDGQGRFAAENDAVGDAEVYRRRSTRKAQEHRELLRGWASGLGLPKSPDLWAESPPVADDPERVDLYVPIEVVSYGPVGVAWTERPESWVFLPLGGLWRALEPEPTGGVADEGEGGTAGAGDRRAKDGERGGEGDAEDRGEASP